MPRAVLIGGPLSRGSAFASGLAALATGFYLAFFARMITAGEVFHRLGFDWTMFWAQAMVLRARGGAALYDVQAMNPFLHQLATYYRVRADANLAQPVPYPPWFAALVAPFTFAAPPYALALWYCAQILALLYLAFRLQRYLPRFGAVGAVFLMLAAVPVATDLYMGQVALLLAIPVGEMLISFQARRDFRAGLWLSVLLIKPQYAVLYGVLILWKMRGRAIAGAILGTLLFACLAVLTSGIQPFFDFPAAVRSMADFQGPVGGSSLMINWRSVVLWLDPRVSDQAGVTVVGVLSIITAGLCLLPWRGAWNPDAPEFAPRFCLLTLGVLISSYHSHLHGAALMVVPLAAAWSRATFQMPARLAIAAALYLPTLILVWSAGIVRRLAIPSNTAIELWYLWPSELPALLFILAFACMTLNLLGVRTPMPSVPTRVRVNLRGRRARLIAGGATCVVVIGALLSGAVIQRVRAREALPDVFTSRNLTLAPVVRGLTEPVYVVAPPDGTNRMFIVERGGLVRIADSNGELSPKPFLDVTEQLASSNDGGLLGLAFHPRFAENGYVYAAYTALDWSLRVVRYTVAARDPDAADASTAHTILVVPKQSLYDNAGMLAFGPDGYLYIGVGDDQVSEQAQDLGVLTGKILRLDVDSGDPYAIPLSNPFTNGRGRPEVWAYGLRNPSRFSFDRATGDLWIGDIHHVDEGQAGHASWESVEFQPAQSPGGENFGFPAHFFGCVDVATCQPPGVAGPVVQYDHNMNCSVTGGYVYRGSAVPALFGAYIFGDYCTGGVFAVHGNPNLGWSSRLELGYQPIKISSFGEDAAGELYVADSQGGTIYRATGGSLPD